MKLFFLLKVSLMTTLVPVNNALLDNDNTLLKTITEMNSTLQNTAQLVTGLQNTIKAMNATNQQRVADLLKTISAMNTTLQNIVHNRDEPRCVFLARLTNSVPLGQGQQVVFDDVITNVGNGYNRHNGHFSAPVAGYYHFSATLLSMSPGSLHVELVKNGVMIAKLYGGDTDHQTAVANVNIALAVNDIVWLKHVTDSTQSVYGSAYSSFSGFLISETI